MTKEIEEEKPFRTKPQTVKRDRRKPQTAVDSRIMQMFQAARSFFSNPVWSFHAKGLHSSGHKGQQAKAQARRRRGNQIARMSRRVNRQRTA